DYCHDNFSAHPHRPGHPRAVGVRRLPRAAGHHRRVPTPPPRAAAEPRPRPVRGPGRQVRPARPGHRVDAHRL
ncbi:MAG: hypothetical protein AVDCRST_MAG72-2484, partial [uncultured Nocardioidaceae bacterium]